MARHYDPKGVPAIGAGNGPNGFYFAQLLGQLQGPIAGLANVLNGPISGLARVLQAHADNLEQQAAS